MGGGWLRGDQGGRKRLGKWGPGTGPGLCRTSPPQEAAHSAHTCGLADPPLPRLPAAARRRLGCWGLDAALLGSGSIRPHPGAGHTSLTLRPPHPPGGASAPPMKQLRWGWGGDTPGTGPWGGVRGRGAGRPAPPPAWVWKAPGRPLPAHLLPPPPWEEARLPQNADLDEMVFYGDLLKRGEIPVKDLQLSKHRVGPAAAARAQSPESASPERVPPPRLCAPTASP